MLSVLKYSNDIPTVDLHNLGSISEALDRLDIELSKFMVKEDYCRVIYGIGEGILSKEVLSALEKYSFIKEVKEEESGGSCIVFF